MAVRNLGYLKWENDLSWLESQKGSKWDSLIQKENTKFKSALKGLKIPQFGKPSEDGRMYKGWKIVSEPFTPEETWIKSKFKCKCWNADLSEDMFVASKQDSRGFERFTIEIYKVTGSKISHLKTISKAGPTVAIFGKEVWFTGSDADLRYNTIESWSEDTSVNSHYTCKNLEENLELRRGEDGSIYAIKGDFSKKQYALISSLDKWTDEPGLTSGIVSSRLKLPGIEDTIELYSLKAGWVVTRSKGIRTIWKIGKEDVKAITWIWGDISSDPNNPYILHISDIRYEPYSIHLPEWKLTNPKPHLFPCSYHEHPLPAFVVHPQDIQKVKGLLITAYGAYGTPTHVGSLISRWKPILQEGWIVISVMVPGSGDHDEAWVKLGQRQNRLESIKAFKDSIEALQEEYGFGKERTALYGRSAGGLLVASVAILNPGLVGALYLESPYVDILRTITNPKLPLTTLETSEFGSIESATNVLATAAWSPMEHIPAEGIPDLFVVARTDTADLEVFPYEILKFIQRVRASSGKDKLVFIHKGRGHFTTSYESRAEDLALLDNWIEDSPGLKMHKKSAVRTKNIGTKYNNMAMTRNRKNRATRKDRKDRKNRNNAPAAMMGGRKSRKGSRKHRKGSRKH